jgi:hypothetical protein
MRRTTLVLTLLLLPALARAEDEKARRAREELERELKAMVGKQPTRVRVDFVAVDDPNYKLEEASFELDGKALQAPTLTELSDDTHLVWNGDVAPGRHTLKAKVVYANGASVIVSDEGGHKWKVAGDVSFDVNSGIEVQVRVVPTRDPSQKDIAKRFRLALPAKPVMVATLDDGKMPDAVVAKPPPPPPPPAAEPVDAGAPAMAEAPKQVPPVKHLPTTEPVFEDVPLSPPNPGKLAATTELKPSAVPAIEAPKAARVPPQVEAADAGPVVAGELIPVPMATAPAPAPAPPSPMEEGWPPSLWGLIGVLLVVSIVFIVLLARRRAQPPKLDD